MLQATIKQRTTRHACRYFAVIEALGVARAAACSNGADFCPADAQARAEPSCPAASECACECDAEQHQQDKHLGSKNVDASADATNDDEGGTWIYFGNAEVDAVREQGGARTASVKPPPAQAPREPERRAPGSTNRGEHSDGSRATGVNRQSSVEQVEQEFQKQREAAAARRKHLLRARDAGVVA